MRTDAVWNPDGYWEAPRNDSKPEKPVSIEITKCIIQVSEFGSPDLYLNGKRLKSLTFDEFLKYRNYVKEVRNIELYGY